MPSRLKSNYKSAKKWQLLLYYRNFYIRIFLLHFPNRKLWRFSFFKKERWKITNQLNLNDIKYDSNITHSYTFPKLKFKLILPSLVQRSGISVDSDINFCYYKTLEDIQMGLEQSNFKKIPITPALGLVQEINSKTSQASNVLILDGNIFYSKTINEISTHIKYLQRLGRIILVDLPDCYATKDGLEQIEFWKQHADLIVYHNPSISVRQNDSRLLLWPGFPLPLAKYERPWGSKEEALLLQGSAHRQRNMYLRGVKKANLPVAGHTHSLKDVSNISISYTQYIESIKSRKFVFTNGYLNPKESIIVGRAFETLASGSVLLYERGSELSYFYTEYKDFIPIYNIADLVEKVKFLISNPAVALQIASNAKKQTQMSYNSETFWNIALSKLNLI